MKFKSDDSVDIANMQASIGNQRSTSTASTQTTSELAPAAVSAPQQQKKTFHSLSADLKSLILSYIVRPSDLKNVCLVSKLTHTIAVRYLYREIDLTLGSQSDNRLTALLNPNNIGLRHIRQIRLYLATAENVCASCSQEKQAWFATRMLLEFLPENILEEFSWCPWRPFPADSLLLLFRKQKQLKWLEAMNLDRPLLADLQRDPKIEENLYSHVRRLALFPENRETLQLGGRFVEKVSPLLEELVIHAHFPTSDDDPPARDILTARDLNDSATGPGLVTGSVFAHLLPFDTCKPFSNLTAIRLHKISLRQCANTWCKFINFSQIKALRLFHCAGTDTLLDNLCRAAHLPKKLQVLEIQQRDNSENELLLALDGFLCLVSGIQNLELDLQNVKTLPAAAGIARHGKTLERLNIHASDDHTPPASGDATTAEELVYSGEDFEKICLATQKLEQLSCAWPERSILRAPDDHWSTFETRVRKLRDLVTLHITTWPSNAPGMKGISRASYETLMRELSRAIFEIFHTCVATAEAASPEEGTTATTTTPIPTEKAAKLNLIAFGINERIYDHEDSKQQLLYLRSKAFNAEGRPQVSAAPVGWCARQYLEPRSEVVDFALDREVRMPVKREPGDAEGIGERRFGGVWDDDDEA